LVIQTTLVILESLRQQETQTTLLAHASTEECWHRFLGPLGAGQGWSGQEAEAVAYGIRWCEIVLGHQLDPVELLNRLPLVIEQWTRDRTA
jgi:hypothetical protein